MAKRESGEGLGIVTVLGLALGVVGVIFGGVQAYLQWQGNQQIAHVAETAAAGQVVQPVPAQTGATGLSIAPLGPALRIAFDQGLTGFPYVVAPPTSGVWTGAFCSGDVITDIGGAPPPDGIEDIENELNDAHVVSVRPRAALGSPPGPGISRELQRGDARTC